jgi:hypothetical protein
MSPLKRSITTMLSAVMLAVPAMASDPPAFAPGPVDSRAFADTRLFAFVKHFERVVAKRDAEAIKGVFDVGALMDRVCEGLSVTPAQRSSFARTVGLASAAAPYLDTVGTGGHVRFLRVREIDGRMRALYRLTGDVGLNYHDAILGVTDQGQVSIVDVYVYDTGEMLSVALRRILVGQLGRDAVVPPARPDAVGADLVALQELIGREKWDQAIQTIGRIGKAVGNDPYLDTLRAYFLCERGTYDRAAESADRSIQGDPMLEEARLIRLRVAMVQHDFVAVAESLTVLERDFGWVLDDLGAAPAYGLFVRSPSYKRWMTTRRTALVD